MSKNMVHILFSGLGGTTDYVAALIGGDQSKSYNHHVILYGIETPSSDTIKRFEKIADSVNFVEKKEGRVDKRALSNLAHILKKSHPVVISLHVNSLILSLKKICPDNCKILFVEHQANHLKSKKELVWSALAQTSAHKVISLTTSYQKELKKRIRLFYKKEKNVVIKSGIDLVEFTANTKKKEGIQITMIGRINSFRDHKTLINAFNAINNPDLKLIIAGDGPLLQDLKESCKKNSNIEFMGHMNHDEIITLLLNTTIYTHATLGETSSIAIMQAQAAGLPIIASNVVGINNILHESNSILVDPEDELAMKNALIKLIEDAELRAKLSQASKAYALENLDAVKLFNAYKNLIS